MSNDFDRESIHAHFGLSYASYLVLPRSVLQSMPGYWQKQFVAMLRELGERFELTDDDPKYHYTVHLRRQGSSQFVHDPLADYSRGRRTVPQKLGTFPPIERGGFAEGDHTLADEKACEDAWHRSGHKLTECCPNCGGFHWSLDRGLPAAGLDSTGETA